MVERNIEDDDDLHRRFLERIPVIELDGRIIGELVPDPERLRSTLLNNSDAMSLPGPEHVDGGERRGRRRFRAALAWRGRAALALPPGSDPGPQDGQGDDLLPGARGVDAHQLHPDPPRPLGLRQVRKARRRLPGRVPDLGDPQDHADVGPAQHRAVRRRVTWARRSPARTSSATTDSRSSPCSTTTPTVVGTEIEGVPVLDLSELDRVVTEQEVVVGVLAVPNEAAQDVADRLVEAGVQDHLQLLRAAPSGAARGDRPHVEPRRRPSLRALLLPGLTG